MYQLQITNFKKVFWRRAIYSHV